MKKSGYVYVMASKTRVIYTGVTSDPTRRIAEHRERAVPGFSSKYHCTSLVFIDECVDMATAIEQEKVIKGWRRSKKIALIELTNPEWRDLAEDWYS